MKAQDSYEDRIKMAEMHDDVLKRIDEAIKKKRSIEACWLCYACFENRITRTLEKVSVNCSKNKCSQNPRVGITTRIECLKRLRKAGYPGVEEFDVKLLNSIEKWCRERNTMVHDLINLKNYIGLDYRFLKLAEKGKPLLEELYQKTTQFRNKYYEMESMPALPQETENRCRLKEPS